MYMYMWTGNILSCTHILTGSVLWYRVLFGWGSVPSITSYFVSTPFAVVGGDQLRSNLRFSSSSVSVSFSKLLILTSAIISGGSEWLSILQYCVVGTRLHKYWLLRSTRSCGEGTLKAVDLATLFVCVLLESSCMYIMTKVYLYLILVIFYPLG